MTNWTSNRVTIKGPDKSLRDFKEYVRSKHPDTDLQKSDFDFFEILPQPERIETGREYDQMIEEGFDAIRGGFFVELSPDIRNATRKAIANAMMYGFQDWYSWRMHFWGVRWNAGDVWTQHTEDSLFYGFETPDGAPYGICKALRRMFPELTFEWQCLNEEDDDGRPMEKNPKTYRL